MDSVSDPKNKDTADQHVEDGSFSGPWHHRQLLEIPNYVASSSFPDLWEWLERDNYLGDILVIKGTKEPVYCSVVGIVSADNLRMQAHGNYSTEFKRMKITTAKQQFTLKRPSDTVFADDFDKILERFEEMQAIIAIGDAPSKHFIINDDKGKKCIRLSHPIFEQKTNANNTNARQALTAHYPVSADYKESLDKLIKENKYIARPALRVHCQKTQLKIHEFETQLVGALVEVAFSFKHYTLNMPTTANGVVALGDLQFPAGLTNVFSSVVHQVVILQDAPDPIVSPFESHNKPGPLRISQSSPKKPSKSTNSMTDLTRAAATFGPQHTATVLNRVPSAEFLEGSSTMSTLSSTPLTTPASPEVLTTPHSIPSDVEGSTTVSDGTRVEVVTATADETNSSRKRKRKE